MAKAYKTEAGTWRVLAFYIDPDGVRRRKSFTSATKKEAEYTAAEFLMHAQDQRCKAGDLTVGKALDDYIKAKAPVLSPSTVRGYKQLRSCRLQSIMDVPVSTLTVDQVQAAVSVDAEDVGPKTLRNAYTLLCSALRPHVGYLLSDVTLPPRRPRELYVPTKSEVSRLLHASAGTDLELPILLAVTMGLRRSEICGLNWSSVDLKYKRLRIEAATVRSADNSYTSKGPKSEAGYRTLTISKQVLSKLRKVQNKSGHVVSLAPDVITLHFIRLRDSLGLHDLRFHDLRHYYASVMLALGIPNKYAAARMGHSGDAMLQRVYQHLLDEQSRDVDVLVSDYFNSLRLPKN